MDNEYFDDKNTKKQINCRQYGGERIKYPSQPPSRTALLVIFIYQTLSTFNQKYIIYVSNARKKKSKIFY